MDLSLSPFINGHWVWDEDHDTVAFVSHDVGMQKTAQVLTLGSLTQKPAKSQLPTSIKFKENLNALEKITYRKLFQRHVKPNEPDIIILQDIKDVVLYLAQPKDLNVEFIKYMHLPEIDRFLKATIVYFHYYLQVWENMLSRRIEARRKLRQPLVTELENLVRDDLSDLRSMMAREYCVIIMGLGKVSNFHHLSSSTNSLSEKDRRLFEALTEITVRITWIAHGRKHLGLIELELNRLMRTDFFNSIVHKSKPARHLSRLEEEDRVLVGLANKKESKLKQRSGLVKEIIYGDHDYRMLGIGYKDFQPKSDRVAWLEKIFAAPEEILYENGITIGLIGIPREEYDCIMMPRERTSKNFDKVIIEAIEFKFPPDKRVPYVRHYTFSSSISEFANLIATIPKYNKKRARLQKLFANMLLLIYSDRDMPKIFPLEPCIYKESPIATKARETQHAMWRKYLLGIEAPRTIGSSNSILPTKSS